MAKLLLLAFLVLLITPDASAQYLFVGLEGSTPITRSSDLEGFPDVQYQNHYAFDVSGAAATPDGQLFLCNGAFTTDLYTATLDDYPDYLCTIDVDISALAYGNNTLYGYSNYASPKGIYAIDPQTGESTLMLDVYSGPGYRFFALDFNPADGLLYGYTEYGDSGLYSINLDTGEMIKLVDTIPASNGQGRALAVGNNTVYLTATRGDDQIPCFAYDIAQGIGGAWVPFTNPYPDYHSTGGAAWIPDPMADVHGQYEPAAPWRLELKQVTPNPATGPVRIQYRLREPGLVKASFYDISGRCVAALPAIHQEPGTHSLSWDGRDTTGLALATGAYWLRLEVGGDHRTQMIRIFNGSF